MKVIKSISFLVVLLLFFNCDNISQTNNQLVVNIDAVIQKSDSINVYYTMSKDINFTDTLSFWKKVNGSKKNQKIEIVFPDSIQPNQIRLDFGRNIKQPDIVINKISISYKKKSITLQAKGIF